MNLKRYVATVTLMIVLVMAFSSCTTRLLDFTVISSKNTDMTVPASAKGDRVEGKDSVPIILVPLGTPNLKEAVDRAIESAGPQYDALIDGVLYYKYIYFLFGKAEYIVEGTPVISSQINTAMDTGADGEMAMAKPLLYHSRTGKSNDDAIQKIEIKHID